MEQLNNYGILSFMCCIMFGRFNINTTAFCSGRSSLHLLLLKSYMSIHKHLKKPLNYNYTNLISLISKNSYGKVWRLERFLSQKTRHKVFWDFTEVRLHMPVWLYLFETNMRFCGLHLRSQNLIFSFLRVEVGRVNDAKVKLETN